MRLEATALLILLLLTAGTVFAETGYRKVLMARILVIDGNVSVGEMRVAFSDAESEQGNEYLAKLLNKEMETLYQSRFSFREMVVKIPQGYPVENIEGYYEKTPGRLEALLVFPYFEEAEMLAIGKPGEKPIAFLDLKKRLCNNDGKCLEGENFISCPQDCPLEETDGLCLAESDGICDPDCVEGLDPDCTEQTPETPETGTKSGNQNALLAIAALIALSALALFLRKRKTNAP